MKKYKIINKIFSYLPRRQINNNSIILLHLRNNQGYDLYCFNKYKDCVFLYCDTHDELTKEFSMCPVQYLEDTQAKVIYNSKMIGKTYEEIKNGQY